MQWDQVFPLHDQKLRELFPSKRHCKGTAQVTGPLRS